MIGNVKPPWVALLVALTACAALASPAPAEFESETEAVTNLSVSSNAMQSFKTSAGSASTMECTTIAVDGALAVTATSTLRVTPTYSSCENFIGLPLEVKENGCHYDLPLAASTTEGSLDIECPTDTGIDFTAGSTCGYEIDAQNSLGTMKYANKGTGATTEFELQPSVTGITITRYKSNFPFLCPAGSSTGTYTGNSTITGSSGSGHVGIRVD